MSTEAKKAEPVVSAAHAPEAAAAPSVPGGEAARDPYLLPFCLLSAMLWGVFVYGCLFVIPSYVEIYERMKLDPPLLTRMVLGFRHPAAVAILSAVCLIFTAGAHLAKLRTAALALVLLALLVLIGGFLAVHLPYEAALEKLVR
ncbi:MAG: hypothetical protein KIS92_20850 [Planctomycetota bacterium]|nr:hypothetical protein [Planctomycetota bacterium]